jgi:transcriptional regulator with XRE-family HTH domain
MVVDAAPGSTVPRRQLGRYLRDARGRARMSVRAAAEALEWSETKIWRIETGQTAMRSLDVEAMCRVYATPAPLTEALVGLAKQAKERGWWHAYGDVIPAWFDPYIGVQEAAADLRQYQSELVPGLLQTREYAQAVIAADADIDPAEVDRRVDLRMQRQALLTRPFQPPDFTLVLNESVIQRPIGGARVMADQCRRLADMTDLPNFSLYIVPFSVGLHHGVISGPFTMLRFPRTADGRETEPPIVYVESFTGALYLEKPTEVERYEWAFERIMQAADKRGPVAMKHVLWAAIREMSG